MSTTSSEVTYQNVHDLLTRLGFHCETRVSDRKVATARPRENLVYRHPQAGTTLFFPSQEAKPILEGELVSLRMHLVGRGHIEEDAFEKFVEARTPAASS